MRVQDLRDNARDRQIYFYNKRGWSNERGRRWLWQFCFKKRLCGDRFMATITIGGEDPTSISISLGLLWFSLYLTFERVLPERFSVGWYKRGELKNPRWFEDSHGRESGAYLHENHLRLMWNSTVSSSGPDRSKYGWSWFCFIDEKIFGRRTYAQINPKRHERVEIWFPEGTYHLNVTLSEDTWTYKRWPNWPLKTVIPRCHIDVVEKTGIPVPGKGENSWDCGDDSTHGLTCPATSLHEAIEAVRETVNNTRRRHGSGESMYLKRSAAH